MLPSLDSCATLQDQSIPIDSLHQALFFQVLALHDMISSLHQSMKWEVPAYLECPGAVVHCKRMNGIERCLRFVMNGCHQKHVPASAASASADELPQVSYVKAAESQSSAHPAVNTFGSWCRSSTRPVQTVSLTSMTGCRPSQTFSEPACGALRP